MSRILNFFANVAPNDDGRFLKDIMKWKTIAWEQSHTAVQWVFPTVKPSAHNLNAPLLTNEDIKVLSTDPLMRNRFEDASDAFLKAYGMKRNATQITWDEDFPHGNWWAKEFNHNYLRMTRVIDCYRLLGFTYRAELLLDHLMAEVNVEYETILYWSSALTGTEYPPAQETESE